MTIAAPSPRWLSISEARNLPRDHPGLWVCACGAGWLGTAVCYPDSLRTHAIFRAEHGEKGPAHDPGAALFRPDTPTDNYQPICRSTTDGLRSRIAEALAAWRAADDPDGDDFALADHLIARADLAPNRAAVDDWVTPDTTRLRRVPGDPAIVPTYVLDPGGPYVLGYSPADLLPTDGPRLALPMLRDLLDHLTLPVDHHAQPCSCAARLQALLEAIPPGDEEIARIFAAIAEAES